MPLHIVAAILARLDTIRQLVPAILSHRIFHDAFKENRHSVARGIIEARIPPKTLPFVIALLESTRVNPRDYAFPCSAHLSLSDYDFLSQSYAAAEFLARDMAKEVIPVAITNLSLDRQSTKISRQESFRLTRAFLRYQLMVNLFCLDENRERELGDKAHDLFYRFFLAFSPWVNEQLMCAYAYLERKVSHGKSDGCSLV